MPTQKVKLFLLCENRLLREALLRTLGKRPDLRIVGAAGYSLNVCRELTVCQPQVILLDALRAEAGQASLLHNLQTALPAVRIVLVGMESKVEHFLHAVREGAVGFVLREASASEITQVVSSVIAGQAICPSCFSAVLFRWAAQRLEIHRNLQGRSNADFSRREEQVAKLVCWGLTNKEIAVRLHLSQYTVRNHVHRILRKTGASDRISLIDRYVEQFPSDETTEEPSSRMIS